MKYKQEHQKVKDKYDRLLAFCYNLISDLRPLNVDDSIIKDKQEELQKIVKGQ